MNNEVKKSLETVFQYEKLTEKQQLKDKKTRRSFMPTIVAITAIGIAIGLYFLQSNDGTLQGITSSSNNMDTKTHVSHDIATIFHLKNNYIGDNSAMSEIVNHVLGDYKRDGIALQTTERPYGLIIPAKEAIPTHIQLKLAFYVFSLIPNADYIAIEHDGKKETITRQALEEAYALNFNAVDYEEDLLKNYYDTLASYEQLPEIQTNREDSYKYLFNALKDGTIMSDMQTKDLPSMTFEFEDDSYSLWLGKEAIWLMKHADPYKFHLLKGEHFNKLKNYLTNDLVVAEGVILEIRGSQLLIAEKNKDTGELNTGSIWVSVDKSESYQIGEKIKAWSNAVNESYPAQASATKVKRQQ